MGSHWAPKPLRPVSSNFVEGPVIVKGLTPIQVQRRLDGTPYSSHGPTALKPPQPRLTLKDSDIVAKSKTAKGSLAGEICNDTEKDPDGNILNKSEKAKSEITNFLINKGVKLPVQF